MTQAELDFYTSLPKRVSTMTDALECIADFIGDTAKTIEDTAMSEEQRRYEIAKDYFVRWCDPSCDMAVMAERAARAADILIEELMKKED